MISLNGMTALEKATKSHITKYLQEEGHKTYAAYFQEFDFHLLPKESSDIAFMLPNKWEIYLNSGITDLDDASMLLRHEMLHQFLKHGDRFKSIERKRRNQDDDEPIVADQEYVADQRLSNIAADWELSKYYSKIKDFPRIKHLKVNGQDAQGLVLELDRPDWLNLSFEEIFEKLKEDTPEMEELRKRLEHQINESTQEQKEAEAKAAAACRRGTVAKETAAELRKQAKQNRRDAEKQQQNIAAEQDIEGKSSKQGKHGNDQNLSMPDNDSQSGKDASELEKEADQLEKAANMLEEAAETLKDASDEQIKELEDQLPEFLKSDEEKKEEQKTREQMDKALKEGKLAQEVADEIKQEQKAEERAKVRRQEKIQQMKSEQEKLNDMRHNLKWCRTMTRFVIDLNNAIKKQVDPESAPYDSYTKPNKRFMGMPGTLRPGQRFDIPKKTVPVINVYYDRSGSWCPEWKTAAGNAALKTLDKKYVKTGKIKINLFYETNGKLYDHYVKAGGSGMDSEVVLDDIAARKPDNVIIMTDSDADFIPDSYEPRYIPGNVWYIFAESAAPHLIQTLRGRKGTYCYDASSGTGIEKVGEGLKKQPKKKLKLKWRE